MGGVDVAVDGFAYTVTIRQEFPKSMVPVRCAEMPLDGADVALSGSLIGSRMPTPACRLSGVDHGTRLWPAVRAGAM